jgi:hypothetical protein
MQSAAFANTREVEKRGRADTGRKAKTESRSLASLGMTACVRAKQFGKVTAVACAPGKQEAGDSTESIQFWA